MTYSPSFVAALIATYAILMAPANGRAASFDCAKASSPIESLICTDSGLSKLDNDLAAQYRTVTTAVPSASDQVRRAQRHWLNTRNKCDDAACIRRAYENRISELRTTRNAALRQDRLAPGSAEELSSALPGFKLRVAQDVDFCVSAGKALRGDIECRNRHPESCRGVGPVLINGVRREFAESFAQNQHGYTVISRSIGVVSGDQIILYVYEYQGAHSFGLQEAYAVDARRFEQFLDIDPDLEKHAAEIAQSIEVAHKINAEKFAQLLASGVRLGNSPLLVVVELQGSHYVLKYNCPKLSTYEGSEYCPHIDGFSLLTIVRGQPPEVYCKFEEQKSKKAR